MQVQRATRDTAQQIAEAEREQAIALERQKHSEADSALKAELAALRQQYTALEQQASVLVCEYYN